MSADQHLLHCKLEMLRPHAAEEPDVSGLICCARGHLQASGPAASCKHRCSILTSTNVHPALTCSLGEETIAAEVAAPEVIEQSSRRAGTRSIMCLQFSSRTDQKRAHSDKKSPMEVRPQMSEHL